MTPEEKRGLLLSMMEHPGWKVLVEDVLPAWVRNIEHKIAHQNYTSMDQVWADQALVKALESLPNRVNAFAIQLGDKAAGIGHRP